MKLIDLRSDTTTQPCQAMREVMATAQVGDDVFGDDPTVIQLQEMAAELTGHEAALYAASGTQSNLIALLSHCQRGEEYIVGQDAHTYKYEAGGAAVLGSIQPQPIDFAKDGSLPIESIKKKIKPDDPHFAMSRLVAIENTVHGKVLPESYLKEIRQFCSDHQLILHMDGARVWNAAIAQSVPVKEITQPMDSVSICLSKGLGAPVGSLICGDKAFIERGKRWRKMLGGGMRQAGILAAAAIYAIENNFNRLEQDHVNAKILAQRLSLLEEFEVTEVNTNMVFARLNKGDATELAESLAKEGVLILPGEIMRFVLHKDIDAEDVETFIQLLKKFL